MKLFMVFFVEFDDDYKNTEDSYYFDVFTDKKSCLKFVAEQLEIKLNENLEDELNENIEELTKENRNYLEEFINYLETIYIEKYGRYSLKIKDKF